MNVYTNRILYIFGLIIGFERMNEKASFRNVVDIVFFYFMDFFG